MITRFAILLLSICSTGLAAQHPPGEFDQSRAYVQVADYVSPSGRYVLNVNPNARDGMEGAKYTMRLDGKVLWDNEFERTLWNACVSDSGQAGGYGYSPLGSDRDGSYGSFHVLVIDPLGELLVDERTQRILSPQMHTASNPKAYGVIAHSELDIFFIRLVVEDGADRHPFWAYRLSTGERLGDWAPELPNGVSEGPDSLYALRVKPLMGLGLFLIHWWHADYDGRSSGPSPSGGVFSIVNGEGETQWKLVLPKDYTVGNDKAASKRLEKRVRNLGAISSVDSPGQFTVWSAKADEEVTYSVV